jgi:hypothetical protein
MLRQRNGQTAALNLCTNAEALEATLRTPLPILGVPISFLAVTTALNLGIALFTQSNGLIVNAFLNALALTQKRVVNSPDVSAAPWPPSRQPALSESPRGV